MRNIYLFMLIARLHERKTAEMGRALSESESITIELQAIQVMTRHRHNTLFTPKHFFGCECQPIPDHDEELQ